MKTTPSQRAAWVSRLAQCAADVKHPDWVSINALLNDAVPALISDVEDLLVGRQNDDRDYRRVMTQRDTAEAKCIRLTYLLQNARPTGDDEWNAIRNAALMELAK